MTDPIRSLLAEMAEEIEGNRRCLMGDSGIVHPLAERARAALAAAPPAPDPHEALAARPLLEAVVSLATWGEEVYSGQLPALQRRISAWLAENPPGQPPAPDHIPAATKMVGDGDGEREELAQWMDANAKTVQKASGQPANGASQRFRRAAALLRQPAPAPVPVPVAERPWEREGWCDAEGRCWWLVLNQSWPCVYLMRSDDDLLAAADEDVHCLPHWAIPQPPQGGEVAG